MPLSIPQQTIAACNKRFRVAICGRRFGKTILSIRELCKSASKNKQEVWYIAPSYRQAKGIVWRKLKTKLMNLHWIEKVNESELTVELKNGSRICLKGADNPDSLRGVGLNFIVMDEFADIDPVAFYEVLRPTLADKNGSALFIGTPKGTGNWSYDLYMAENTNSDWKSFHYTTLEGGNVPQSEIDAAMALLDPKTFDQEFNASFVTSGNRVWYGCDAKENVKPYFTAPTIQTPKVLYTGWDFNIDPMSVVIFTRYDTYKEEEYYNKATLRHDIRKVKIEMIHAIDEIEIYGSNTDEAVQEITNRYPQQKIIAYPDPASRQRKTSAGGKTDLNILKNAGFTVKAPNKHNAIRDGVNAVNSKLCSATGERTFLVDPNCKKLIKSLDRHNYKPGTTIPDKDTGYDHITDATRYAIDYMFPIRRASQEDMDIPQIWGHRIGA